MIREVGNQITSRLKKYTVAKKISSSWRSLQNISHVSLNPKFRLSWPSIYSPGILQIFGKSCDFRKTDWSKVGFSVGSGGCWNGMRASIAQNGVKVLWYTEWESSLGKVDLGPNWWCLLRPFSELTTKTQCEARITAQITSTMPYQKRLDWFSIFERKHFYFHGSWLHVHLGWQYPSKVVLLGGSHRFCGVSLSCSIFHANDSLRGGLVWLLVLCFQLWQKRRAALTQIALCTNWPML